MKYNDNGTFKEIHIKALDTLPIGAEVDYDGEIIPNGWTEVESLDDKLVNVESEINNDYDINILKGKNLFGGHFESIQKNGITTSYSNGILTIDGTATATTDIRFTGASLNLKPNTPYTITAFYIDGTINGTAVFYWQNGTVWRGFSLTLANSTTSQTRDNTYTNVNLELNTNTFIRVNSGASFDNYQIKIQIEQNETSTSYEAYITPSLKIKGETIFTKNNLEQYWTAETKIGTWIDGKPLYRKIIQDTVPATSTNGTNAQKDVVWGSNNALSFVEWGFAFDGTAKLHLNYVNNSGYWLKLMTSDANTLRIISNNTGWNNKSIVVSILFTKTTD